MTIISTARRYNEKLVLHRVFPCFSTYVMAGDADRYHSGYNRVRRWFPHPEYADIYRSRIGYYGNRNDIALVQLDNPLTFSDTIKPICLPEANTDFNSYSRCYITGWGQIDPEYSKNRGPCPARLISCSFCMGFLLLNTLYWFTISLSGTGNAPEILQQGKINIIPMETCKNWYYERWAELFRFKLPYQAPVHEDFHVCLGNQESGGRVSACFVSLQRYA